MSVPPGAADAAGVAGLVLSAINAAALTAGRRSELRWRRWRRVFRLTGGLLAAEFLIIGLVGALAGQLFVVVIGLPTGLVCAALLEHERRDHARRATGRTRAKRAPRTARRVARGWPHRSILHRISRPTSIPKE